MSQSLALPRCPAVPNVPRLPLIRSSAWLTTVRNRDCTTACWFSAVAALVRNQPRMMNHSQL